MRRFAALLATIVAASASWGQGPYTDHQSPPDVPGVERIDPVIEAFNAGDAGSIERCIGTNFTGPFAEMPLHQHVGAWSAARSRWGEIRFEAVRAYDPPRDDLVVIVRAPLIEAWRAIVFQVAEDGRFTGLSFSPARPPSYLPPASPLTVPEAAAQIDGLLDRWAMHDLFSGAVLIVQDGRPVLSRAVGLASRRFDVPNNMDTKFNLGSMNKMFTAVAIAQLVEQGKVSFDDPVGRLLPEYPNEDVRNKVLVKHLLSHTSGMGSHFTDEFVHASKADYRDFADYFPLFEKDALRFEPGSEWAYSNAGFFLLGKIIETASGESYYDYVRRHIFAPAGMTGTDSYDMDIPVKNLAIGYTRESLGRGGPSDGERWIGESNGLRNNLFMHSIKGGPAGGGFSTAPDLIRFAEALTAGRLVSSATLEALTTAKPELNSPAYGYGFSVEDHGRLGPVFGHGGGFPGINGMLDIYPEQRLYVAVLANIDGGANLVAGRFMELIERGH